ncbi:MAG TPA: DUF4399 domain-containing protein [Acidimicrobiia bacterium]
MRSTTLLARAGSIVLVAALTLAACGNDDSATVAFAEPTDGATLHGAVQLAMTADGITIEEAGAAREGAGHFHVIADAGCVDTGAAIDKDADHVHFGAGQSEGLIYLEPGEHDLCLQVGDGVHSALDVTDTVSVTVAVTSQDEWCDVMAEADEQLSELDALDDFVELQAGWEKQLRLLAQLSDAIDFVDDAPEHEAAGVRASPREHVNTALAFAANIGRAFTTASDEDAAFTAVEELYESAPDGFVEELPGADWIQDTCGIDLED